MRQPKIAAQLLLQNYITRRKENNHIKPSFRVIIIAAIIRIWLSEFVFYSWDQ